MANLERTNTMALMGAGQDPSNASPAPKQQQYLGVQYGGWQAKAYGYGAPIRPEDPSIPQLQELVPGQYDSLAQVSDVVDNESGNDLELGNFSRIDLDDLNLPVNEEQIFQALDDEKKEERKKGEEGEVVLVEDEEEEDLETKSKKLEQEKEEAEAARKEEDMNQKLIEQLLSQDMLETRVQTLRKRGRLEKKMRKQLTADKDKAQEE
ncbi:hypothetical protein CAEBREN_00863 [Caenorhabditis brenneri]|uniref:Uncharacterized protein n=1 Tax=Caenorhabditis brenneri TaxID=135651 RepID=G0P686_CAEBE|nr:hypothetical protein CAEBREN_00863 [Caenorhabditis brenneri]